MSRTSVFEQPCGMKIVLAVVAALIGTAHATAAPQQLNCTLAGVSGQPASPSVSGQPASPSQPIVILFDQDAETLQAQVGNQNYSFGNVSVSAVAISGDVDSVSLGIDLSSLGMVWQQYADGKATIQFGQCRLSPAPVPVPAPAAKP